MHLLTGSFPILPAGGSGVYGHVSVAVRAMETDLSVSVGGLPAMSSHAIHIHAGTCQNPYGGMHLYILGTLTANRFGNGVVNGFGPRPYAPYSRYVIVYASLAPDSIIGCANLGPVR